MCARSGSTCGPRFCVLSRRVVLCCGFPRCHYEFLCVSQMLIAVWSKCVPWGAQAHAKYVKQLATHAQHNMILRVQAKSFLNQSALIRCVFCIGTYSNRPTYHRQRITVHFSFCPVGRKHGWVQTFRSNPPLRVD
jgi:hypothetical protein